MTLTKTKLEEKGFIIDGFSITEIEYSDYLREYGADETTSPRGVAPRIHIREVGHHAYRNLETLEVISESDYNNLDEGDQNNYDFYGEITTYQVWTWGVSGNNPRFTGLEFETEEEARIDVYEHFKFNIEKNWDAPTFHSTEEDAIEDIANREERSQEVIRRYLSICAVIEKRKQAEKVEAGIRHEAFKKIQGAAIKAEAEVLVHMIDQEFMTDCKNVDSFTGTAKSAECSRIFVNFLNRCGHIKVQSDFWKVFRILYSTIK